MAYKRYSRKRVPARRFKKRWNVSASANVFGYKGALKLGSRGFTQAVKQVIVNEGGMVHMGYPSFTGGNFLQNTIYTLPIFSSISRSTTETGVGFRGTDKIKPLSYHIKGSLDWAPRATIYDSSITFMIIKIDDAYLSGSALNVFQSGVGSSNIFRFTNSTDLQNSTIDTSKCSVIAKHTFHNKQTVSQQNSTTRVDIFHKFKVGMEFKYNTGTNFADRNYYVVVMGRLVGGATGVTAVASFDGCVDLVYQDPA